MNHITKFAENFMKLFQLGGETFISWMTNIVPLVLMLLIAMNTLSLSWEKRRSIPWLRFLPKILFSRYMIFTFSFQPLCWGTRCQSVWDVFLPEYYKPSFVAAQMQFCHTSNGVFPHINPGELFVWMGIATGIQNFRLESNGLSHSLHACWDCHELCMVAG